MHFGEPSVRFSASRGVATSSRGSGCARSGWSSAGSRGSRSALLAAWVAAGIAPGCAYDFDSPFAQSNLVFPAADGGGDVSVPDAPEDSNAVDGDARPDTATDSPPADCDNESLDGDESDVDCGGDCPPCAIGKHCNSRTDCSSPACVDGVCCEQPCDGPCLACTASRTGAEDGTCTMVTVGTDPDDDCAGTYACTKGGCESCGDGVRNGPETGTDCGGVCQACSEDCTNGIDDNNNGAVDCADSLCDTFTCAQGAAPGWTGPVALFVGVDEPPECDFGTVAAGGIGDPSAPPAQCNLCICSSPDGISCPPPQLELFDPSNCQQPSTLTVTPDPNGSCTEFIDPVQYDSVLVTPSPPAGGFCVAMGGEVLDIPTATWNTRAVACLVGASPGGGCSDGASCYPTPPTPFLPVICIARPGDHPCPSPQQDRYLINTSMDDTRACQGCSCTDPTGATCVGGGVTVYGSLHCTTGAVSAPIGGGCAQLSVANEFNSARYSPANPLGGTCTVSGGGPTGSAQGSNPVTVCCSP